MKKLNITLCSFPDYSGNAKALYEYMVKRNYLNHRYVWIVYNQKTKEILDEKNIECILIGTDEFRKYIKTTDVFFTTQGNLDGNKTDKSLYIELWHGVGPKAIGYLCKNPSHEDIKGYNNIRKIVDYLIVPSDFWKVVATAKFHIEASRIKSLGMPVFDYFINSNGKENLEKLLDIDIKKYKKIIFYMPTYKKGFNHIDIDKINTKNIFNFEKYSENRLNKYLEVNDYLLCVKRHPGEETTFTVCETNNIKNITEEKLQLCNITVNEIINSCDLMITDYSSIGTEFVFLDKPVLYAINDIEEYKEKRGVVFSNFDFWSVGPKCTNLRELLDEIEKIFSNDAYFKKEKEYAKKLWFDDLKDGGCDKICNFIFDNDGSINNNIEYYKDSETEKDKQILHLENKIEQLKTEIRKKEEVYVKIINSKGWKILEKARKIYRRNR